MKEDHTKDDWIHLDLKDISDINLTLSYKQIDNLSKRDFKNIVE